MTDALLYTGGVLLLALGIAISIGLHEAGHFLTGRLFNVRITQFFIGFGRTVWSRRRGETEYGLKAVPLGGYVKLVGMLPPAATQAEGTVRDTNTGMFTQLVSDARSAEYEIVRPEDEGRLFYKLSWWKKVIVMAAGPTVNLLIAFGLFSVIFMAHGAPQQTLTISDVSQCVIPATEAGRDCTATDPVAPAKVAGLQPGDTITSFGGVKVSSWDQLRPLIRDNGDRSAVIGFVRDGQPMTATVKTIVSVRPAISASTGTVEPDKYVKVGFLGVLPETELVPQGPGYVVSAMGDYTWATVQGVISLPVKVYHVGRAVLGLEQRSADSPVSVVGAGRIAGEVASDQRFPLGDRFWQLMYFLAGINLFVGMLNFVPLLPLDGGHIAGALYEAVRRGFARLFGRPDPGYFDVAKLLPVAYAMASVFIVMSVLLIYADLVDPISIG
jgi:membrane-associated protease RseP (regulator of RpoE activity)